MSETRSANLSSDLARSVMSRRVRWISWRALLAAVWTAGGPQRLVFTAGVALVMVVLAPWAVWWAQGRTIAVHRYRVVVRRGEREVRTFAFDDLSEAGPGVDGSAGAATPESWNTSVTLLGRPTTASDAG